TVLGTRTLGIRPTNADSVNIRMSNTLGTTLFGMLRRKSDTIKINSAFTKFFKGLQLSSNNANVIYGFKDSVVLRMYYHETDNYYQNRTFDFVLNNNNFQWNNISADRTGTNINSSVLGPGKREVASTLTANLGYSQSASGLYLKISFPNLRNLLQRPDYTKIISAQLIIKPVPSSYNGLFALPPQLVAATTDVLNQPGGVLTSTSGGSAVTETGNLNIDHLNANNTSYSYDVTSYLVSQIGLVGNFQNGLLLIPPSNTRYSTLQRLVMGDPKNPNTNARIQLKVYYISVTR
ncbi:MAG TPA: hypothetical protein VLD19_01815, partial [Chitinophagaceae bacterium]|nr:hypothetical protein [Chitinophagaceae bacterium]